MTRSGTRGLFLTLGLFFSTVGACVAEEMQGTVPMSVDDAVMRALAHDPVIELARLDFDAARIDYDRQRSPDSFLWTRASAVRAESTIRIAELEYSRRVNNAIIGIIDDAYALQAAELSVRTKKEEVAGKQKLLELIISKVAAGAAGRLDELSARAELNAARADLSSAELSMQQARVRFNRRASLPEGQLTAIGGLPAYRTYTPPDDAFARARNADPDLAQRQAAVSLARIELETARAAAVAPLDIRKAENGLAIAEAQAAKTEDDLHSSLQSAIAFVQQAADDYLSTTMSLQLARQRHDIILQQNDTGQKTDLDVLYDTIALDWSETRQLDALRSYTKGLLTFEMLIGADLRPAGLQDPGQGFTSSF